MQGLPWTCTQRGSAAATYLVEAAALVQSSAFNKEQRCNIAAGMHADQVQDSSVHRLSFVRGDVITLLALRGRG